MKLLKLLLLSLLFVRAAYSQTPPLDTLTIQSKIFNTTRKVVVALPSGYDNHPDQNYVTAYLFDAQSADFFNFYRSTVKYLTQDGYIQPLILIGVVSENRQYEFTPQAQTEQGRKYFQKSGGAELLARHISEEVMPLIRQKYRTNHYNIGIGHSLGATFVTYSLLHHAEIFNAVIAISPNYQYDNMQLVHQFDSLANHQLLNGKFLYIAHGNGDAYEDNFKVGSDKIDSILQKRNIAGLRWQFKSMDNDSHGTTALEGIFKGLIALYRELTIPDKQISAFYKDHQISFFDHLKGYYEAASQWSGLSLPMADDINNVGYNCYYAGKNDDAVAVLNYGLTQYPDNVNLYDSIGEIETNTRKKSDALNHYLKGLEVVKKQEKLLPTKKYNSLVNHFENKIKTLRQ
jgi:predicted alpha/beta superfamily hydrolase